MGGIGVGFNIPQRMNQPQQFLGGNQPFGFNSSYGKGLNPNYLGNTPKLPPPPTNFRPF